MVRRLLLVGLCGSALCTGAVARAGAGSTDLGPVPSDLPQTWLASLHASSHVFHPGDIVTVTVKVNAATCFVPDPPCVKKANWSLGTGAGKILRGCAPTVPHGTPTVICRFRAKETDGWTTVETNFDNPTGTSAISRDFYAVVDNSVRVLSGFAQHPNGRRIADVPIAIDGPGSRRVLHTDANGFYSMVVKKGSYTVGWYPKSKYEGFSTNPLHVHLGKNAEASFVLREKHAFDLSFNGAGRDGNVQLPAGADHKVTYHGRDWDKDGSPITVAIGDQKQTVDPATATDWQGDLSLATYPDDSCRATVAASQDGTVRKVTAWTRQVAKVLLADGTPGEIRVGDGRATPTGSFVCDGEQPNNYPATAAVYQSLLPKVAGFDGLRILDPVRHVSVSGEVFAKSIQIPLVHGGTKTIKGPGGGDTSRYDWSGRPGVVSLNNTMTDPVVLFSGLLRVTSGDLHITGHLKLDGGAVYAPGSITIDGGVEGVGAIIAGGSITIKGAVDVRSDGANALRAGGKIVLAGQ